MVPPPERADVAPRDLSVIGPENAAGPVPCIFENQISEITFF
jgi:hypothetical protein